MACNGVTVLLITQTRRPWALTGQTAAPVQIFTRQNDRGARWWVVEYAPSAGRQPVSLSPSPRQRALTCRDVASPCFERNDPYFRILSAGFSHTLGTPGMYMYPLTLRLPSRTLTSVSSPALHSWNRHVFTSVARNSAGYVQHYGTPLHASLTDPFSPSSAFGILIYSFLTYNMTNSHHRSNIPIDDCTIGSKQWPPPPTIAWQHSQITCLIQNRVVLRTGRYHKTLFY